MALVNLSEKEIVFIVSALRARVSALRTREVPNAPIADSIIGRLERRLELLQRLKEAKGRYEGEEDGA